MSTIYGYANKLWKEIHNFTYTGSPQEFTLQPGTYLVQCHGAPGGSDVASAIQQTGGSAYGILTLNQAQTMYAHVGGVGGSSNYKTSRGIGGWNGGGDGGDNRSGYNSYYGSGGGGATDIRLKTFESCIREIAYLPTLPTGYTQVQYLQSDGSQYFDTGYIAKENTTFVFSAQYDANRDQAILGTQPSNTDGVGWVLWLNDGNSSDLGEPSGRKFGSVYGVGYLVNKSLSRLHGVPSSSIATYRCDKYGTFVNDQPLSYNRNTWTSYGPDPNKTILFLTARRGNDVTISNRMFVGKVYFLRIYEMENNEYILKHEFIPCIQNSNNAIGMYDTIEDSFIEQIKRGSSSLITGPTGMSGIDYPEIPKRDNFPTLPEEYSQVEYIEGTGSQYFDTGYVASREKDSTFTFRVTSSTANDTVIFGSQSAEDTNPAWICWLSKHNNNKTLNIGNVYGNETWDTGTKWLETDIYPDIPTWFQVNRTSVIHELTTLSTRDPEGEPDTRSIYLFNSRIGSGTAPAGSYIGKLYHFNIYEKEHGEYILKHSFIPCIRKADNVAGLYDILADDDSEYKFLEPIGTGLLYGTEGAFPIIEKDLNKIAINVNETALNETLNTRFIVAGGGGGRTETTNSQNGLTDYGAIGGGIIGAPVKSTTASIYNNKYASQTDGYAFGNGQKPQNWSNPGHGGGGGGWFGGYACELNNAGSASGGGGSSYVCTASSYKPTGYTVPSTYYMTNPYMEAGTSDTPQISISELIEHVSAGDTIIIPCTGAMQHFTLEAGEYVLKCWGGCGGIGLGKQQSASAGGYSEGTIFLRSPNIIYCHVGGSGLYDYMLPTLAELKQLRPSFGYNGGGQPSAYGSLSVGHAGGGATDIRIGHDSLYSRVIVAGGAGGGTTDNKSYYGGPGGGASGGYGGNTDASYSPGPGTQTGSPIDLSRPTINGGFGYGGNGTTYSNGYYGGAGGGGWYGGSGAQNDARRHVPGNGGSGYVFTESSYKPTDFLLTDEFYLTNASTVTAGNNLSVYGKTQIEIDVVSALDYRFLCRDDEGIKRYNEYSDKWVVIPDAELSDELFETYGAVLMTTDAGLLDDYEILVYDKYDSTTHVDMNVTPNKQILKHTKLTSMTIKRSYFELEYDPNNYTVDLKVSKHSAGAQSSVITTVTFDKLQDTDVDAKVYFASYMSK